MTTEKFTPVFTGKRIWMYWPGERAYQFEENVEKGFMACGLPEDREVGDLNKIMNVRGGLDVALKEAYGLGARTAGGRKLLVEFANTMKEGDFVLARNEFNSIIGVGIVTGDYYYDETRPRFRHCRKVEWVNTEAWPFLDEFKASGKWHRVTLIDQNYRKIAMELITYICEGEDNAEIEDNTIIEDEPTPTNCLPTESHGAFMSAARHYQEDIVREWSRQFNGACIWDERPNHGVWLKEEYALKGLVFYEGFRDEIMKLYRSGRTKISMNLLKNALRSEHIPYNLFFPMMSEENEVNVKGFFSELLNMDCISEILDVRIEYAPRDKWNFLNDGTSFDTYVLYRHVDGRNGAIGIEVKYTEREYYIGDAEYKNTHDAHGNVSLSEHYLRATRRSGYYLPGTDEALVSDDLRQIWRNHILGASMVQRGMLGHFSSLTIFPNANPHFHEALGKYRELLTNEGKASFHTVTYEKMFEVMRNHFCSPSELEWIDYLDKRYIF